MGFVCIVPCWLFRLTLGTGICSVLAIVSGMIDKNEYCIYVVKIFLKVVFKYPICLLILDTFNLSITK